MPGNAGALDLPWLAALSDPATYPHPVGEIRLVETHLSVVALTGEYAYKLKKPVDYGFVDFSTLDLRRRSCETELKLNRRTAAEIYLDVVPLVPTVAGWRFGAAGPAMEYALRMREFPSGDRLDRVAERGELSHAHLEALARCIADLHERAREADDSLAESFPRRLGHAISDNFRLLPDTAVERELRRSFAARLAQCQDLLEKRARGGRVRDGHGDLHLANICLWRGEPVPFDCLEFNESLRVIDVLSDVAFLCMDLMESGHSPLAYHFLSTYLEITGDYGGLPAWPLFIAYRAHVRAKVAQLTANSAAMPGEARGRMDARRNHYLELAARTLEKPSGGIVMMAGLPASGKSTEAFRIARERGGVRVRSDVERKRLHRSDPARNLYGEDLTRETYEELLAHARAISAGGLVAVLDATYSRRQDRQAVLGLAREVGVALQIVHCDAPLDLLMARARVRSAQRKDASDAGEAIVRMKAAEWEPFTTDEERLVTRKVFLEE